MAKSSYILTRKIKCEENYDLVVAGGGPGGCGAAISAARMGAKVLLIEATGCLGGMGTSGLVAAWSHMSNGRHSVIGGLMLELVETMNARGFIAPTYDKRFWTTVHNRGLGFNAEGYKLVLDEWCTSAGVEVRFFTKVLDADVTCDTVNGVILHNVEGFSFAETPTVIDATGDAILAHACGAATRRAGHETPNIMPPTLCSLQTGIDYGVFHRNLQQKAVDTALEDDFFSQPDRHVPGLFRSGEHFATMNAGHLFATDALDNTSLSEAMRKGRRLSWEYTEFFRKYVPGCERMELIATAPLLGVRESRRIVGEAELTVDDYHARRTFPDQIAIYCKQTDIHVYAPNPGEYTRYQKEFEETDVLQPGEFYGIPYGILVPKGWNNLWVAGRCCSSDLKVNSAIRDQPACVMMGQAAGTAALQALRTGQRANKLDSTALVKTLRDQGANLP